MKNAQQLIDELMEAYADSFYIQFQEIEQEYLNRIAKTLKDVGSLNKVEMAMTAQLSLTVNKDLKYIQEQLIKLSSRSQKEIEDLCLKIASEHSEFSKVFYKAKGIKQVLLPENKGFKTYVKALVKQTGGNFAKLSINSVKNAGYQSIVNKAVLELSSGIGSPQEVIRRAIVQASNQGLYTVDYKSGLKRRLDSAVRTNILDTANQINIESARIVGEEYGADGFEISAHSTPAPDHKEIQGKQYTAKEYEKLNKRLKRPIGTRNCYHFAFPILIGISQATYSKDELEQMRKGAEKKITIDGRTKTKYEWTQEQRKIEAAVRTHKSIANTAKVAGDRQLRENAQAKINALTKKYNNVSSQAGLDVLKERMTVAGFRNIKVA